ncbi:MAG: nucleotide exchange factor GrpE [Actinomycetia bacterium]|nr:nucleotide exchange factor GrpE [Actinomycetes bacterium]
MTKKKKEVKAGDKRRKDKTEIVKLKASLDEKERLLEEYINDIKRLKADFENHKKQMLKEQTKAIGFASEGMVLKILPVFDNFERALEAGEKTGDIQSLLKGFKLIYDQLFEILGNEGLESIEAKGKIFNPNKHEAMMRLETGEHDEDAIVEVFEKGYALKGKVIRPAKVKVAKKI